MGYAELIAAKRTPPEPSGFGPLPAPGHLFGFQREIAAWAVRQGRAAVFADCGLGKTPMQLEWARNVAAHTGGRVLAVAPLAVAAQTVAEGARFGVPVSYVRTPADLSDGISITNYEMVHRFGGVPFAGVVLDESSILKGFMGKTKRMVTEMFAGVPYRSAYTATPSPNDLMELLNHAEFLGIMRSCEALSVWFIADQAQSGRYRLKGHAETDFWDWVSSWAVALSKPSDMGYDDEGFVLPPLTEHDVVVDVDSETDGTSIVREPTMSATGFHAEKRFTLGRRVAATAGIVNGPAEQFVVWCCQNAEADALKAAIPDAIEVRGSHTAEAKERAVAAFLGGDARVLVSKPSIFGFGLNFQSCSKTVFCGMDYSYEGYYQAVRRFYRFGQTRPVDVWRVVGSTERTILDAQNGKAAMRDAMQRSIVEAMRRAGSRKVRYTAGAGTHITVPAWMGGAAWAG